MPPRVVPASLFAAVTATAGGVLFTGDLANNFLAAEQRFGFEVTL